MPNEITLADDVKLLLEKDAKEKDRTISDVANEILRERLKLMPPKTINQGGVYPDSCIPESDLHEQLMEHISQPLPTPPPKSVIV